MFEKSLKLGEMLLVHAEAVKNTKDVVGVYKSTPMIEFIKLKEKVKHNDSKNT